MKSFYHNSFPLLLTFTFLFVVSSTALAGVDKSRIAEKVKTAAVPFIANQGQVDKDVSFYANTLSGKLFVTHKGELVYTLPKIEATDSKHDKGKKDINRSGGVVLREKLVGAKIQKVTAHGEAVAKVNYFKGNDPNKWQSGITTYEEVSLGEVYEGIELRLKAYGNNVEKLFYVSPGVDPLEIRLALYGVDKLTIIGSGELQASTRFGDIKFTRPIAWQEKNGRRVPVQVAYNIISNDEEHIYAFHIGSYDKSSLLIIDPLLASTYLGGLKDEEGLSIAIDSTGNVYVTGKNTNSSDYPTTTGAYDENFVGQDIIISKLSSDLSTLLASTFIGGIGEERGHSITLDSSGNVYVTGFSSYSDYPTTPGAYDESFNGGNWGDIIISKLSPDLSTLLASTFLGGAVSEWGYGITIDSSGNVYITGDSSSAGYPTTTGAYDESYSGGDIIVSKLSSDLSTLLASTFLGGTGQERATSIALDSSGNVYVTGWSFYTSTDYPTTPGAYDESYNGGDYDIIIAKLSSDLTTLHASTFLGGTGNEWGNSITSDSSGIVYVTGYSLSADYPTSSGAYDESHNGNVDVIISKLSSDLSTLLSSTFLGGTGQEKGYSITLDSSGNVYVTGFTSSTDYPNNPDIVEYDESYSGGDIIVSKLSSDLSTLLASTFLGGTSGEWGNSITLDTSGNVYITGFSGSTDYPTTAGAYDESYNSGTWEGNWDIIISKLTSDLLASSYTVQASAAQYGNLDPSTISPQTVYEGSTTQFIFNPDPGYHIETVTGCNGSLLGNIYTTGPITEDCIVSATFAINQYGLSVTSLGNGTGSVTFSPLGISCGNACYIYDHGASVTLTATEDLSSIFTGWSGGGCSGAAPCILTMQQVTNVTATFTLKQFTISTATVGNGTMNPSGIQLVNYGDWLSFTIAPYDGYYIVDVKVDGGSIGATTFYTFSNVISDHIISATFAPNTLTVSKAGTGIGVIYTDPPGIYCGVDCSQDYLNNTSVLLTAAPDTDSTFSGWTGDGCSGVSTTCTVTMDQARHITATFISNLRVLTLNKNGNGGTGTVNSTPAGLSCDPYCTSDTVSFADNTLVTLQAISTPDSEFKGWTGGGCLGVGDCTIFMTGDVTVTATFDTKALYISNSKAIIVAGTGEYSGNFLWPDTILNANYAYRTLITQGFTDQNIQYLNSDLSIDVNGDSWIDVDDDANLINLQNAVTSWATNADQVVIYMVGHGDEGKFILKRTDVPSEELLDFNVFGDWLDILQQSMTGQVIVIYDACRSGSLIAPTGRYNPNRIVLTSSDVLEKALFARGGRVSFSYQFWSVVFEGGMLAEAFNHGNNAWNEQHAQFDINNDGIKNNYNDIFPPITIGEGIKFASGTIPSISDASLSQNITDNELQLWTEAYAPVEIVDVWAVIVPPSYDPYGPGTGGDQLPVVSLTDPNMDWKYEGLYSGFTESGKYQVSFYAMNKYHEISLPVTRTVTVSSSFPWILMIPILQGSGQGR